MLNNEKIIEAINAVAQSEIDKGTYKLKTTKKIKISKIAKNKTIV